VLDGVDVDEWLVRARAEGVAFERAKSFTFDDQPRPFMRLGFAEPNRVELEAAALRLAAALPPCGSRWRSAC
jgi:DNA-binding transcriptional MocR family regulator